RRASLVRTDPAPGELHTLSLRDALPISFAQMRPEAVKPWTKTIVSGPSPCSKYWSRTSPASTKCVSTGGASLDGDLFAAVDAEEDRKSTRLNSSHVKISYAVFCLKKKTA